MSKLTRNETAEPVSRDQILRHERGQGNINFPCSADRVQDWQPYPVGPYSCCMCDYTYIHTYIGSLIYKPCGLERFSDKVRYHSEDRAVRDAYARGEGHSYKGNVAWYVRSRGYQASSFFVRLVFVGRRITITPGRAEGREYIAPLTTALNL